MHKKTNIKSTGILFSGQNGVMVSTYRVLTTDDNKTIELNDKNTFKLQTKSHENSVNGILCEQSNWFNSFNILFSITNDFLLMFPAHTSYFI